MYYELIMIDGKKKNLPQKTGRYNVMWDNGKHGDLDFIKGKSESAWVTSIKSYFSPVSVEKETVYVKIPITEAPLIETIYQVVLEGGKFGVALYALREWHCLDELPVTHWLKQSEVLIVKQ